MNNKSPWWSEEYGFFGKFYVEGDNSKEGFLIEKKQSLRERTLEEVDGVIRLLSLEKGAHILDCPCGYGRHSIELAGRGFNVIGCDINSAHLAIAKENSKTTKTKFIKKSMLNLDFKEEFDAVINMFYSFGFFETDKENEKVLKNFFDSLKKGGRFLMHTDVNVPRMLAGKFKEYEKRPLAGGGFLRQIEFYHPPTKRNHGVWVLEKNDKVEIKEYSVRVFTKEEFVALCKKVGFGDVKVYADWKGTRYSEDSEEMMIVATK